MDLRQVKVDFDRAVGRAASAKELEEIRIEFFGKKGALTTLLRTLGTLPPDERRRLGKDANEAKEAMTAVLEERLARLRREERLAHLTRERVDVTLPGTPRPVGSLHPLTQITDRIREIFVGLGFEVVAGPEVESEYHNFEALNIPADHPAREMWDSFYLGDGRLLRTHTSPVQIHVMEGRRPPLRVISAGKCYRRDAVDATHHYQFHQVEGFMVDRGVTFAHLKGTLAAFTRSFFGEARKVRFAPEYFPFTEPSAGVEIDCFACEGRGCRVCKESGWIEVLGCGMIHPYVFRKVGYDPEAVSGFAFGMGIERLAMLSLGVSDIRLFFENDLRFLEQFP